jgi:hypothetical protein
VINLAAPPSGRASAGRPRVTNYWFTTDILATECVVGGITRVLTPQLVGSGRGSRICDHLTPGKGATFSGVRGRSVFAVHGIFLCIGELA